ncbi:tubulin-specific chaperone E-like isoform X2 [Pomacea canaliculata]|uniref:tubulin-specific chaperone E-like isoform X2 n=1 Tax=Pomacea canaliculata TaxID=400727 RepID=UPI000D73AFA8|nr:tubulin-specific chaperone E-like isoform X2 [Pomacea canaliculata]
MAADDADLVRPDGSILEVGDRIRCDVNFGTVKYIGIVPPTKGVWLGIEWDDPTRGKHDGSHEGVRYFQTSHPNSGSFLRPKKACLGIDCFQAIQSRYGIQKHGSAGVNTETLYVLDADNRQTVVEMVGAEKVNLMQSQLNRLQEVSIRDMDVYGTQSDCELSQNTPSIQTLDVSRNLIASWPMVAKICQQLPNLQSLFLSENKLHAPTYSTDVLKAFKAVRNLYLNKMSSSWHEVLQCCSLFPILETLYVSANAMQMLEEPQCCLQQLTTLSLENNNISSWDEVMKLGKLQQLETLVITDNPIERIYFPDVPYRKKSQLFPKLKHLYITLNKISDWASINELNKLQNLEDLGFGSLPHLGAAETVREIVIAKIGNLTRFNRTDVNEQERKGAEIDYLKKFGPDWLKAGGNQDSSKDNPDIEFQAQHPRFCHLVSKWGAPENSEMVQQSLSLKDNLITIKIFSPQDPEKGVMEKKLPSTMSVQKLKTLIQRIFRLDKDFTLSYISHKMQGPEIEFDNELRQISFYSVENGDTIQVKWR